jgi:hypothetical protein
MKLKTFLTTLLIMASLVFGMTGCNKTKALTSVRKADELAAKLLIYGRNIAQANNESFRQGNIPEPVHKATNEAVKHYLDGVDVFIQAINSAKTTITNGGDAPSQLDILEEIFNQNVVGAGLAIANLVTTIPAALADKIGGWAAAIQLAITSFRALIAETRVALTEVTAS